MSRILVVMPNWFGETLFATPFLRRLHESEPDAEIVAIGVGRSHDVLRQNPRVEQLLVLDERSTHRGLWEKVRLIQSLRRKRFDAAYILRRSATRTALLALAGVPRRIGFANPRSGWLLTDRVPEPRGPMHKARTYLSLIRGADAGGEEPVLRGEYYPSDGEREWAGEWFARHGLAGSQPVIVLHPGANWDHKRWPAVRFAELATRLHLRHAGHVLLTGAPHDRRLIESIQAQLDVPVQILAGEASIRQLAACLDRASVVVTNDTGPAHLTAALSRPLVALYGPTSPTLTGPLGDPRRTTVIHHADCCPQIPCFAPNHPSHPGMESISVDEVDEAVNRLLQMTHDK